MKNIAAFLMLLLAGATASAFVEGRSIVGIPQAIWDEGGVDHFALFNSLIDDQITLYGEGTANRQADTCILASSFSLVAGHIPDDAIIEQAYLVWMGAVAPDDLALPTDNSVHLKFSRQDGYEYQEDIVAGDAPKTIDDTSDLFLFEGFSFTGDTAIGCSETNPGTAGSGELAYFTYRTDVTPFFQKISDDNRLTGTPLSDGTALQGTYTFSGLDCTDDDRYRCNGSMVSSWSILLIYRSGMIRNKEIYLYRGLSFMQDFRSTVTVSGFEFPKNPMTRITAMTAEGDTGTVSAMMTPELLYIKGESATSTYQLTNECNPYVSGSMSYEIYNSNSSIVGWDPNDQSVSCFGGGEGNYLGIDVDTFLLDPRNDVNLQEHFTYGGTSLDVNLSVNRDAILTNYLIVSVDTAAASFDIPPEATDWPQDREKNSCSCRAVDDPVDTWCEGRPMYFLIKVQNWGENIANDVIVIDELDDALEYVAGSTEIATQFDYSGNGVDWTTIPDKAGAAFPLSGEGFKIVDAMDICNQATWTCTDTRLIRFKVIPKTGIPANRIIYNMATIKEEGSDETLWYHTNKSVPLRLHNGVCLDVAECPEPSMMECGGLFVDPDECNDDSDCPEHYFCDPNTHQCVKQDASWCTDATVSFGLGINALLNGGGKLIVPAGTQDLVVGQFTMNAEDCAATKGFELVTARFALAKDDQKIEISNLELIYDKNGSGTADPGEEVLATAATPDSTGVYFILDNEKNFFHGNGDLSFLIRADVGYQETQIPGGASFFFSIAGPESFAMEDAGTAVADGDPITFAKFQIEPTGNYNYFIVTRGLNDPSVPAPADLRKEVPMLQLRTKALAKSNDINFFRINIPTSGDALFGHGIRSLSLYFDIDNDGLPDGDPFIKRTSFSYSREITFQGDVLEAALGYIVNEEKHIIITCDLTDLCGSQKAVIEVEKGGILLSDNTQKVEGLPIRSKEFYDINSTDPADSCDDTATSDNDTATTDRFPTDGTGMPDTDTVKPKDGGCGCSMIF